MRARNITVIALVFLFVSLIFNFTLWRDLIVNTPQKIIINDSIPNEFLFETAYQNILRLNNPFASTDKIFYPFKFNFSLSDPSTSFSLFFLFLRPFFDTYRSLLLIVFVNIFLSPLIMYFLLQKMKINQFVSFISSLVYGFMPYLSARVNSHFTYTSLYLFPLLFFIAYSFILEKKLNKKLTLSILFGLALAFTLLTNFQYFISAFLAIFFLFIYFLVKDLNFIWKFLKANVKFIVFFITAFIIPLIPWLLQVKASIHDYGVEGIPGFGGAVQLSADVFNLVVPSHYNPIYNFLITKAKNTVPFLDTYYYLFKNSWNSFVYPGLLILLVFFYLIFKHKTISKKVLGDIVPYLYTTLFFIILTFGPFLKVFNQWFVTLDEGIRVFLPMPYLIFHYIPGLNSMRAPSRFTPIYVFFAVIVVAYVLNYIYLKIKTKKKRIFFIGALFLIFLIDQFYQVGPLTIQKIPVKEYNVIKSYDKGTVLEIPFAVRDGFRYIGFVHAISPMKGELIHGHPIIGGYMARVPQKIFDYYQRF